MLEFERYFCVGCGLHKPKRQMDSIFGDIAICRECAEDIRTTKDMTFDGLEFIDIVIAPFLYDGVISEIIREFKFSGQRHYGTFLTALALERLQNRDIINDCDVIIPVPLHENRLNERGFNQSEIIANRIGKTLCKEVDAKTLIRVRDTRHQSSLKGLERIKNVKNAFEVQNDTVSGKKILLVDDIYTMGETANECAKALKNAGAKSVVVFALCRRIGKSSLF